MLPRLIILKCGGEGKGIEVEVGCRRPYQGDDRIVAPVIFFFYIIFWIRSCASPEILGDLQISLEILEDEPSCGSPLPGGETKQKFELALEWHEAVFEEYALNATF